MNKEQAKTLANYINSIVRLNAEAAQIIEDKKEVLASAKDAGFDKKAIKAVAKRLGESTDSRADREAEENLAAEYLDIYQFSNSPTKTGPHARVPAHAREGDQAEAGEQEADFASETGEILEDSHGEQTEETEQQDEAPIAQSEDAPVEIDPEETTAAAESPLDDWDDWEGEDDDKR